MALSFWSSPRAPPRPPSLRASPAAPRSAAASPLFPASPRAVAGTPAPARASSPCRNARRQCALLDAVANPDDGAAASDAGGGESDCQGAVGDPDDGANAVADARAEDGDGSGYPYVKAGRVASRPGYPAEPAARSRPFGRVSLAPPFADAHCALRLPGGSLRSPPCAGPTRSWPRSTAPPTSPPCPPRHGASRRARRGTRFARPGRLRRLRASPRLVAVALRASPVPASPRTAPCSRARTSADTSASASAAVLRTTPCSTLGASARSNAAAAPTRRLRRRRFPHRSYRRFGRSVPPGRPWVCIHVRALQGLSAPLGAWRLLERACNAPNSSAFRLLSPHACPRR